MNNELEAREYISDVSEVALPKLKTAEQLEQANQGGKYWEAENPVYMATEKNAFRLYPKAGRLKISLPDYFCKKRRAMSEGKGIGVNLQALADQPEVLAWLISTLQQLQ